MDHFNDHSLPVTPKQVIEPTSKKLQDKFFMEDMPERDNDSLGILSMKSSELSLRHSLQAEKDYAVEVLRKFEKRNSIPERLLQANKELSTINSFDKFLQTDSTISESDLLFGTSSTPRQSVNSDSGLKSRFRDSVGADSALNPRHRPSIGVSLINLSQQIKDGKVHTTEMGNKVQETLCEGLSFRSGESLFNMLAKDEASFAKANMPMKMDLSMDFVPSHKESLGEFFQLKSDSLSKILAKSPVKTKQPVPLIDSSSESFDLSEIQRILSDSQQTPAKAAMKLLQKRPHYAEEIKENIDFNKLSLSPEFAEENLSPVTNSTLQSERLSPVLPEPGLKSTSSSRSSSALSSLPQGKLPIETTKSELILGCIKIGKVAYSDFIVRNRTSGRLGIKCTLSNPSFRVNDSPEFKVVLHAFEARKLTVVFAPTKTGAAVDYLMFTPLDPKYQHSKQQFIKVSGYGGYGNLVLDTVKDTTSRFILSLGSLNTGRSVVKSFQISNAGNLPIFAKLKASSKILNLRQLITVEPNVAVLLPGEARQVTVTLKGQRESIMHLLQGSSILELGKLEITSGTEVDRGRLRKICAKCTAKGLNINSTVTGLVEKFPGELMPADLKLFRESSGSIEDMLRLFTTTEIVLTAEQDLDATIIPQLSEDTVLFHSLCENVSYSRLEYTVQSECCQVEPNRIILTPEKRSDFILLTNFSARNLYFEVVNCSQNGLSFSPSNGSIASKQTCSIQLKCSQVFNETVVFKCKILVDNEAFYVDVKIIATVNNSQ